MAGWSMLADNGSSLSRCENRDAVSLSRRQPPLLGNGKAIDLLKLFVHVKNRGGYDAVSREGLWESVGEDLGLSCAGLGSAIKLVYYKYLQPLESGLMDVSGPFEVELKAFASTVLDKKGDAESEEGSTDWNKPKAEVVDMDSASSGLFDDAERSGGSDSRRFSAMVGDSSVAKEGSSGQKRKRESLSRMLHWMRCVARDPTNPVIGTMPESSKWSSYCNDKPWKQGLLARQALFLKKPDGLSFEQYEFQKKQKMHPSMFEESSPGSDRVRSSRRLLYGSTSLTQSSSLSNANAPFQKRIPTGEFFQAEVPEWTGMATESDSKWLGTRVWPPEGTEPVSVSWLNHYLIQNAISRPCGCQLPGTTACIKLHINRNRLKLKAELGSTFYHWKFDKMGEEDAVSWTTKDELKFEAVVKENPLSLGKCFWDELPGSFPNKSREQLVSYYYNVFLLRRRGRQNRYAPSNIDSDDDETEFIAKSNSLILSPGKKANAGPR